MTDSYRSTPSSVSLRKLLLPPAVACLISAGCSEPTPLCSDGTAIQVVKQVFNQTIETALSGRSELKSRIPETMAAAKPELSLIRTTSMDKTVGRASCEADLSVTLPDRAIDVMQHPDPLRVIPELYELVRSVRVVGHSVSIPITYTVQVTDDKSHLAVKVQGLEPAVAAVAELSALGFLQAAPPPTAAVPAPAAAASHEELAAPATPASDLANAGVLGAPSASEATRFGQITITDEQGMLFQGKPLTPPLGGGSLLSIEQKFQVGSDDVLLVQEAGGTACPAQFHFVRVSATGAGATPPFGTCSDSVQFTRDGDKVSVSMPGYAGPSEPKEEQETASKQTHVFVYQAGAVVEVRTESGSGRSQPSFSCAGRLSHVEQLVCSTPSLATADVTLAQAYATAVAKADDPAKLKQDQKDWQKAREACADIACVSATYAARLEALSH